MLQIFITLNLYLAIQLAVNYYLIVVRKINLLLDYHIGAMLLHIAFCGANTQWITPANDLYLVKDYALFFSLGLFQGFYFHLFFDGILNLLRKRNWWYQGKNDFFGDFYLSHNKIYQPIIKIGGIIFFAITSFVFKYIL